MSETPESLGIRRIARLSQTALEHNLRLLREREGVDALIDIRADAFGHGQEEVERAARLHGFREFVWGGEPNASLSRAGTPPLYGVRPGERLVLALEGEVIAVKRVPDGSAVSYGYSYRTQGESILALVALGYADGVPRLASNQAHVHIGSLRGVVAGRVAMDQLVVDVGGGPAPEVGATATLWSTRESLLEWASATRREPLTLTGRLGARVARQWHIDAPDDAGDE
jgi:alanine racemase